VVPGEPYRTAEEVADYKARRDPIVQFRSVLQKEGCTHDELTAIETAAAAAVEEAIRFGEDSPMPDPATLYDYMSSQVGRPQKRII
jgi:acetoin:2,6-dichlorophenolindophenol oxidoreductase subunit alpha